MFFVKLLEMFSKFGLSDRLTKMLPTIIIVGVLGGLAYFGHAYVKELRETVEATKQQSILLSQQLAEVKKANEAIAEDMKGVKDLTDTFNTQLNNIRTNQNQLTTVVSSQKFKASVASNVPAAQDSLNQSFNKLFNSINGVTNGK